MLIYLTDKSVPVALRGPVMVDRHGFPRYWASVWSTMAAGHLADSTHTKKLRYIEQLYGHAEQLGGERFLDDALTLVDENRLAAILESWFIAIRNRPEPTDSDEKRWLTGLSFVTSVVAWISKSEAGKRIQRIEERLHRLSSLYRQLHVRKTRPVESIRSLPSTAVEAMYELLDPQSPNNPFKRAQTRWRVFIAFILMLHEGLRRGEVLLLPADAIKSSYDVKQGRMRFWLNVRENRYEDLGADTRYSRPGIKTASSVRQVPVSESTASLVEIYATSYRGRPAHSFLLSSNTNSPLSTEALTKMFAQISRSRAFASKPVNFQ